MNIVRFEEFRFPAQLMLLTTLN